MDDKKSQEILSRPPENCSAEHLRSLRKRAQAALASHRDRMTSLERQLTEKLDEISGALSEQWASDTADAQQAEQTYEDAQRLRKELEDAQAAWQREQDDLNKAIADRQQELDQQKSKLDERAAQVESRESEFAKREQELASARLEVDNQRLEVESQRPELDEQRRELDSQRRELESQRRELDNQRQEFERKRAAGDSDKSVLEAERSELQHKFELALDDVRRLRGRTAELEQELAKRPERDDDGDVAELSHLREERDALAERVEELERQPAVEVDSDTQRQLADFQRRFELAVEDVRELKTANAKLEAELAEARQLSHSKVDSGGMDWESQKQRMLNSLSDDFDIDNPAERKERATIEGTIRITDDVVAKKDDEIARLKEQLAASKPGSANAVDSEHDVNELIDSDEVIQQHRKRMAQLEKEMEEKLRAAELELSVERAKLARKQVELSDWRAELESLQESRGKSEGKSASGVPKRRWLAKLGLGSDDEES
jgi:hypothetical protein